MDKLIGKLEAKLQLLELTKGKTESMVSTGITEKIRRHKEALQSIVISAKEIKREVEQAKLEDGEALDKVKEWGKRLRIENRRRRYRDHVTRRACETNGG